MSNLYSTTPTDATAIIASTVSAQLSSNAPKKRARKSPDLRRVIAVTPQHVRAGGNAAAGILLAQIEFWTLVMISKHGASWDGWFYKDANEWEEETGMTRSAQESARARLAKKGIITLSNKGQVCGVLQFRLEVDVFLRLMGRIGENAKTDSVDGETAFQKTPERIGKSAKAITENTQEITQKSQQHAVAVDSQSDSVPLPHSANASLVERLIAAGYNDAEKAARLVEEKPAVVERQIENLRRQRKQVPNPGGWLHNAIKKDLPMAPLVEHKGPGTPKDGETVFLPECYQRWVPSEPRKFDEPATPPPPPQEEPIVDEEEYIAWAQEASERSEACDEVFQALPREDQTFYMNYAREIAKKENSEEVAERRLLMWKDHRAAVDAALSVSIDNAN